MFFPYHSSGKRFRQNDDVPIVNLQLFFRRNPPPPGAWKKKLNVQNKTKVGEEKKLSCLFRDSFLFWTYEKKTLTHQPINRLNNQKMLQQHLSGKNNKKFRSSSLIFFSYVQNKKAFRKKHLRFFSSLTFVFFWTFTFFFHTPGGGGISSEKKLQIDDRDIVILSKCFSRRMIWKKQVCF